MLFSFTNAFHCAKAPSGGGAPSTLPSRSFGLLMPVLARLAIAKAGLSYIISTAWTFLSGFWSWNLTSELMSKKPIG